MAESFRDLEEEVLQRLQKLDVDTLSVLEKYSEVHSKSLRTQTLVSTAIASIAGAAVTAAYIFPEVDKAVVAVGSVIFGVCLGFFALKERRKEHNLLIKQLLDSEVFSGSPTQDSDLKRKKIEKIVRGGAL